MAIRAHDAVADRSGVVPVGSAEVRPRRKSLTLRREGQLAYALLTPTFLVVLFMKGRFAEVRAYVAGPPPMVDASLRLLLREARLPPADIRYDKFS